MRLRLRFAKHGKLRWTSHRDIARVWERAFRRAGVPVAYTGGFSPRPRISFGLALPTGYESKAEYLDVEVVPGELAGLGWVSARLSEVLPAGLDLTAAVVLPDGAPSLQEAVTSCSWRVELAGAEPAPVTERLAGLLSSETVLVARQRKGRETVDDIRPGIAGAVATATDGGGTRLDCELRTQPRAVRPADLLAALGGGGAGQGPGAPAVEALVERSHQWIEREKARHEPEAEGRPLDASRAPHAEERAS